jgi:hypothetical protein
LCEALHIPVAPLDLFSLVNFHSQEAPMPIPYDKFGEADRSLIKKWTIGVTTFYAAIFFAILAVVLGVHTVGDKGPSASQTAIPSTVMGSAIDTVQPGQYASSVPGRGNAGTH